MLRQDLPRLEGAEGGTMKKYILIFACLLCLSCTATVEVSSIEYMSKIKGVERLHIFYWPRVDPFPFVVSVRVNTDKCGEVEFRHTGTTLDDALGKIIKQINCCQ